jgi:hypothetical protein
MIGDVSSQAPLDVRQAGVCVRQDRFDNVARLSRD